MMDYFNHVCSRLDEFLFKNRKKFLYALVVIVLAIGLFISGGLYVYYELSKEPQKSVHFLVNVKCYDEERGLKYFTCVSEEYSHVRERAFLMEMSFKGGVYMRECNLNKVDKEKCPDNLLARNREQLKKYRELNDLLQ